MKKIFLILSLFLISYQGYSQAHNAPTGTIAPNITITDIHGVDHNLYDYCAQGKYVLIDFFAYWCSTCVGVAPNIDAFYKKYGCNSGNVIVLGNESDDNGTKANLQSFESSAGINSSTTYPTGVGSEGTNAANADLYGINAYPTIVLVGPDSIVVDNDVWPVNSVSSIESSFPTGSITAMNCNPASVSDVDLRESYSVYPNPSTSSLIYVEGEDVESYKLTDVTGRVLLSDHLGAKQEKFSINVETIEGGLYLLTLQTAHGPVSYTINRK